MLTPIKVPQKWILPMIVGRVVAIILSNQK